MGRGSSPAGWTDAGLLISGRLRDEPECADPGNPDATEGATQSCEREDQPGQRAGLLRVGRGLRGQAGL